MKSLTGGPDSETSFRSHEGQRFTYFGSEEPDTGHVNTTSRTGVGWKGRGVKWKYGEKETVQSIFTPVHYT